MVVSVAKPWLICCYHGLTMLFVCVCVFAVKHFHFLKGTIHCKKILWF